MADDKRFASECANQVLVFMDCVEQAMADGTESNDVSYLVANYVIMSASKLIAQSIGKAEPTREQTFSACEAVVDLVKTWPSDPNKKRPSRQGEGNPPA